MLKPNNVMVIGIPIHIYRSINLYSSQELHFGRLKTREMVKHIPLANGFPILIWNDALYAQLN